MHWPDLVYRLAVHDRLCGVAFLESAVGSDYMAVLLGGRVEIALVAVSEVPSMAVAVGYSGEKI